MSKTKRGVFICIEGIDASGKTTQARRLVRNLKLRSFDAVYTTEPSRGKLGEFVRRYVLDRKRRLPIAVEALLFAADRVDHVETHIKFWLEKGKIVVCDRYIYSTLAYQGAAGLSPNWIEQLNRFALVPDVALFLDVPPEIVLKRLNQRRSVMETWKNQRKVREMYMKMVENKRLILIDGNKPISDVAEDILTVVLDFLKRSQGFSS
jgi:dTMP kinase